MEKFKAFCKRKNIEVSAKRYGIDALGAMAQGLFCSLLIGTIIKTLGAQLGVPFLTDIGTYAMSVSGPAMAIAIGYALQAPPMVLFSLAAVGYAADAEGGAALYTQLQSIDPDYAAQVHPNTLPRVIRALELYEATGRKMSAERISARAAEPPYRSLCLCLTCRDRATLYDRIGRRVDLMVKNGVLDEAKQVYDHRESYRTAAQAIGYKEFFPYFEGTAPLEECTEKLKQATRNYAKRQLTWFRRQNDAVWLYIDEENVIERACSLVREFLQN